MEERLDKGKFGKMAVMRSIDISRSRVPWLKMIGFALALVAVVKLLRHLRAKFSKF